MRIAGFFEEFTVRAHLQILKHELRRAPSFRTKQGDAISFHPARAGWSACEERNPSSFFIGPPGENRCPIVRISCGEISLYASHMITLRLKMAKKIKVNIFDDMREARKHAAAFERGEPVNLRVTRIPAATTTSPRLTGPTEARTF